MTIELSPNGVACNLSCPYCYQQPMRDAGNITRGYDMAKMKAALVKEGGAFALFGGDALTVPLDDLEELFRFGYETYGSNGVQTNGALITDAHLALFTKYKVQVGFSLDGPDALNDTRWAGSLQATRRATTASQHALEQLCARGEAPSVIVTLTRVNARPEVRPRLFDWFRDLNARGVRHMRLHLLEVETPEVQRDLALTPEETIDALLDCYAFQKTSPIQFDLFKEMAQLLLGDDEQTTCIWHACDPYTTAAVRGIDGQGVSSNCGRTNKDGVNYQKADRPGYERQLALYVTPQSDLGCQDCRFFFACKGQCPGTAEHRDWRNRSEHCAIWMALFEQIEADLRGLGREPLSLAAIRPRLEAVMLDSWASGRNTSIAAALRSLTGFNPCAGAPVNTPHGDHFDAPDGFEHADAGVTVHGDAGTTRMHGDSHGDYTPPEEGRDAGLDTRHLGLA